jgi:NADP-dependent 3-hydroxy acid dehydrogenase YdfG
MRTDPYLPTHILITGASSGLGAALALAYAAPGIRLSLHGRDAERLAAVADEAARRGAQVAPHIGDVTAADSMAAWIAACDATAPLDLIIANAGISAGTSGGPESPQQARRIFAVNVDGVVNTIQPALPLMMKRGRGQIALVSSLAGFRGLPGGPAYGASKAAVRVYGEALRPDALAAGVSVHVICPGFVRTPMTDVNKFRMPFLMEADAAASLVRERLAHGQARIAFPWPMYALVRLLALLPEPLMDWVALHVPRK